MQYTCNINTNAVILQYKDKGGNTMAHATISARIDSRDKSEFDAFCNDVGISASSAISLFIKAVLRERKIPFEISQTDSFYCEQNLSFLREGIIDLNSGKGVEHDIIEEA